MKYKLILSGIIVTTFLGFSSFAEDEHDHSSHEKKEKHSTEDSHEHSDGDGHNHKKKKKKDSHAGHDDHGHKAHNEDDGHEHNKHKEEDGHDHGSHEGHGGGKAIGKGKAIEEVDEIKGFKLSREAIKTLELKLNTVDGSTFKISKKTLVASKNKKGVYRFRAGFFKFMPAEITKELSDGYLVEVKGVDFGDQIVVNGVGLLRVTDVYSTDKSEYGHSH